MTETFDPYWKWLAISQEHQPPNHYRLLGVPELIDDADVIDNAADQRMANVRGHSSGKRAELAQQILNEIAAARICLLDPDQKKDYDSRLRAELEAKKKKDVAAEAKRAPALPASPKRPPAPHSDGEKSAADSQQPKLDIQIKAGQRPLGRSPQARPIWQHPAVLAGALAGALLILVGAGLAIGFTLNALPFLVAQQPPDTVRDESNSPPDDDPSNLPPPGVNDTASDTTNERVNDPPMPPPRKLPLPGTDDGSPGGEDNGGVKPPPPKDPPDPPVESSLESPDNVSPDETGSGTPARLPIPSDAALDDAHRAALEKYAQRLAAADSPKQQRALGEILLGEAGNTSRSATERYVLLREAGRLAIAALDVELALRAVDEMADSYEIDPLEKKVAVFGALDDQLVGREENQALVTHAMRFVDQAAQQGEFDKAGRVLDIAIRAARKTRDLKVVKDVVGRKKLLDTEALQFEAVAQARGQLEQDPEDGQANLVVGRHRCFAQGDWESGLPLLAKGSDASLAAFAKSDLAAPKDAAEQLRLADLLWDLASGNDSRRKMHCQLRAGYWYDQARLTLTGAQRREVEQRLAEIAAEYPGFVPRIDYQIHEEQFRYRPGWNPGVAFSRDGKLLAVDGHLLDTATGKPLRTIEGKRSNAFSHDGKIVSVGRTQGGVALYELQTGRRLAEMTQKNISSTAFSGDDRFLASGTNNGVIVWWEAATGKELFELNAYSPVRCVAFSANGKWLAASCFDATVRMWDLSTRQLVADLTGHTGDVACVAFSPDSKLLASSGNDQTVRIWDAATAREIAKLTGHSDRVGGVAFSPDGKVLASGSLDKSIKLWDAASLRQIVSIETDGRVYSLTFGPDGKLIATGGDRGAVLWKFGEGMK